MSDQVFLHAAFADTNEYPVRSVIFAVEFPRAPSERNFTAMNVKLQRHSLILCLLVAIIVASAAVSIWHHFNTTGSAKGSLDGPPRSVTLSANDQMRSIDDYRQLIVVYKNGVPIRLEDIARVEQGAENIRLAAWANQQPEIVLNIVARRKIPDCFAGNSELLNPIKNV
ncbi:MAG: hypothetical protein G5703_07970 [Serratia symbiotica]|nr:hypothetical protein [Serratia symbiotica]